MKEWVKGPGARGTFLTIFISLTIFTILLAGAQGSSARENGWRQAVERWKWAFPRDHGSHPEFRTEWWYFTGNLNGTPRQYGYQLTFFRQGVASKPVSPTNPWSLRDLYLGHFTLTDVSAGRFSYGERLSRKGPGLAGASEYGMDVHLLNWSAKMVGNSILLEARHHGIDFHGQTRGNLSSEHGEREGKAPAALPQEGATRAPAVGPRL